MTNIAKFRPFPTTKFFPNGLFDDLLNRSIADFVGSDVLVSQPAVNILETNTSFTLEVAAPGFEKQNFALNVDRDYLTISAQRENTEEEKSERFTRREFRFDGFKRMTAGIRGEEAQSLVGIFLVQLFPATQLRPARRSVTAPFLEKDHFTAQVREARVSGRVDPVLDIDVCGLVSHFPGFLGRERCGTEQQQQAKPFHDSPSNKGSTIKPRQCLRRKNYILCLRLL